MARGAIIIGAGSGLSASIARRACRDGMSVMLGARNTAKLSDLLAETDGQAVECDASDPASVAALFKAADDVFGPPELVVYNPSARVRGPIAELDPDAVLKAIMVSCYGGFLVGQQAARRMVSAGGGSILFTGASASVKGFAGSASFAMGKFGLRGLAQSMARELAPKNVHVAHFVIDGGIGTAGTENTGDRGRDSKLDPDAIAETYFAIHRQHRSAWTWEIELRPWVETF